MAKKIIRLTESELVSLIKRTINEAHPEPVIKDERVYSINFPEGQFRIPTQTREEIVRMIQDDLEDSLPTLEYFVSGMGKQYGQPIPKFIKLSVGTSSTGTQEVNARLSQNRLNELKGIVKQALQTSSTFQGKKLSPETIERFIQVVTDYRPTSVDRDFYDYKTSKPEDEERDAYITIDILETKGLSSTDIDSASDTMRSGRGWYFMGMGDLDPKKIVDALRRVETYTDITDMERELRNEGGLENFLNSELSKGGDEMYWKKAAVSALNKAANTSGRNNVATIRNNQIVIYGIE